MKKIWNKCGKTIEYNITSTCRISTSYNRNISPEKRKFYSSYVKETIRQLQAYKFEFVVAFEKGHIMNKNIDISNIILKTQRMILRPWKDTDLNDFYEYAKVDGVGQLAGWTPHKNIEESKVILDIFIEGKKTFAIEYRNKVIGSLGIECYNEENYPEFNSFQGREIGYVLSKDFWGQDIMPEAVKAVI